MSILLGYTWISAHIGISPVQAFCVQSVLGTRRRSVVIGEIRLETYPPSQRPEPTIPAHLTFALKHEIVHLEFLTRLFEIVDPAVLEAWICSEPSGAYARRVARHGPSPSGREKSFGRSELGHRSDHSLFAR